MHGLARILWAYGASARRQDAAVLRLRTERAEPETDALRSRLSEGEVAAPGQRKTKQSNLRARWLIREPPSGGLSPRYFDSSSDTVPHETT